MKDGWVWYPTVVIILDGKQNMNIVFLKLVADSLCGSMTFKVIEVHSCRCVLGRDIQVRIEENIEVLGRGICGR